MRVSRLELSPASRSRSERGGAWFLGGLSGGCDSAPARCLKQSDLRKEAKETSNAAYRYCNSAESSAGVSPASSAISFNRHPRLFLASRSPGFLTGRKRSVQAWITGSGSHVPEPGGISGYEKNQAAQNGQPVLAKSSGEEGKLFYSDGGGAVAGACC